MTRIWIAVGLSVVLAGCAQGKTERQGLSGDAAAAAKAPAAEVAPKPAELPVAPQKTPDTTPEATTGTLAPKGDPAVPPKGDPAPEYRKVTLPAGTALAIELNSSVGSDSSHVEDEVLGRLRHAVRANGVDALPAGTQVRGHVTSAVHSAKVKGRASIGFRFSQIDLPGAGGRSAISTGTIVRRAPATKKRDAAKIGGGAAGGAIIGGILGGPGGAAKGAAIGGGAGTALVLSTRGPEVHLGPGAPLTAKLTAPLTVRVPVK